VLLVEDSTSSAGVIGEHLRAAIPDADVEHVRTLRAALRATEQSWDVVLLDLGLPDSDGLDTLVRLREAFPRVPIIVLTATDDPSLALMAVEEHAQDFLIKRHIDADLLGRSIRYAMSRQAIYARLELAAADARRNERNLHQLIARSADGIVVLDAEMCVLYCNEAACTLLGRSAFELIGGIACELPRDVEHSEIQVGHGDHYVALDVRMVVVDWEGSSAKMAMLRDVTERRSAEELRLQLERSERLASIGQLAAGVAHEINNPLSYVISNLELLQREIQKLSEAHGEVTGLDARVSRALEGALRVASIVRDLGAFSRHERDATPRPTDVNAALSGALTMASTQLKHRAQIDTRLGHVPKVLANEGRLTQVFLNLLVNAAQAMQEGAAQHNRLRVETRESGRQIVIEIEDTGHGIVPEVQSRIFEPFFTTKKAGEGSGLGLYICRNIIHSYDGTLELESEPGHGTLARIRLPACLGAQEADASSDNGRRRSLPPARRGRVLLVDDESEIVDVLGEGLSMSYEVVRKTSGAQAIDLLREDGRFDVLICDVIMPEQSGADVFTWVSEHRPALAQRMLFMTGGGIGTESASFIEAHLGDVLTKPVRLTDLLRRVEQKMVVTHGEAPSG
jgi:signal transduction histidine kinase